MKSIVVGLGIQGKKRKQILGNACMAVVDPIDPSASYDEIKQVPLSTYDAAYVCTPDGAKFEILDYLLRSKKHVLVEKPLMGEGLTSLLHLADQNGVTCYTAYNHRFEPHFIRMKELLDSKRLGKIYHCRLFYGNGTARDVRNSPWRDQGCGVLKDLGSHLLDTVLYWFGEDVKPFEMLRCHRFENQSPDHVIIGNETIELEMSLLSWRNHFTCDLYCEKGSVHIESLCKWGPSKFIIRTRKLPSGRPTEESVILVEPDPTWEAENLYFKTLCQKGGSNLSNDLLIDQLLENLNPVAV
ncbi:MAG: hypothetical protein S4CHLAM45_01670 [Chlamydiales bacterium]|nr:hypothetical protein [Chlamydiales bacterium]MCH9619486.1 hypothetical protein [Chlamydiales bacterium]MCH9622290.1 hypothetical protein [Chlamydiales bacterium]